MDHDVTRDEEIEETADRVYRALAGDGLRPALIVGERAGLSYRPPRIKLGRLSPQQANRAEQVAHLVAVERGFNVNLSEDMSKYPDSVWETDEAWESRQRSYEVVFVDEEEDPWR
jgi:predicted naringenin-chalcone synthase